MTKKALIVVASGSEDIEFITVVDILRRAKVEVTTASVEANKQVCLQSNNVFVADKVFDEVINEDYDIIIVPGGLKGSQTIGSCKPFITKLKNQKNSNKLFAGICAAPKCVFFDNSLIDDVEAVAYPGFEKEFKQIGKGRVCVSKNCITSIGPGSALEFALKIVEILVDKKTAQKLSEGLLLHPEINI